ncbi:hypothetical protein AWRI1631_51000 [Saccharomyces cerevisiae AWRI1631]|uniref:Uncharacterized protein n=1 Tax=Saccharomyces cerevisiae (strain AWRI1631) TaxID=545124 RepID=B5VHG3_YEAS6|nr:hypothetical protein AWRI1631_51000 [Saccharomyces cerevisiae AWRI1631]
MKHTDSWQERVSVFKLYVLGLRKKRRKIMKQQKKTGTALPSKYY